MDLSPAIFSRLDRTAFDAGFDRPLSPVADWLVYESGQGRLRIWLTAVSPDHLLVALSRPDVDRALLGLGVPSTAAPPAGAVAVRAAAGFEVLEAILRRAIELDRTLPNEMLSAFEWATAGLPRATEAERLVIRRVGQEVFRDGLLKFWEGRCAVTGLDVPELLQASRAKPWDDCGSDGERFDPYNGLFLALHLRAAFESGFLGVRETGELVVSPRLGEGSLRALGWDAEWAVRDLKPGHLPYLRWHLHHVFKG